MNKVEPGGGGGGGLDITGNEPFTLLLPPCFSSPSIFSWCFTPPLLRRSVVRGDQMMKHRLQRLLRPQKEERRSRPQPSTVATVGLEEMKSKVRSNLQQQLLPPQLWRHFRKILIRFFHLNLFLILFYVIITYVRCYCRLICK